MEEKKLLMQVVAILIRPRYSSTMGFPSLYLMPMARDLMPGITLRRLHLTTGSCDGGGACTELIVNAYLVNWFNTPLYWVDSYLSTLRPCTTSWPLSAFGFVSQSEVFLL